VSAVLQPPSHRLDARLRPMGNADLDAVVALEQTMYGFPWSRGNFSDSLHSGYDAWVLWPGEGVSDGSLLGYLVAQPGVGESHLLNITIAPTVQGGGLGRRLLDAWVAHCRARGDAALWLEARPSNTRALAVYARYGFREVGLRRGYYPAAGGQREDAKVLKLALNEERDHALD
jgi:[ribosomal protein S18]-alanine N-acetyltransferase